MAISRKNTTKWNLFFQYVSIALSIISGIVLVPLYLKFIPLDLYGAWLATGNMLVWITMIDPGLSTILMRQVAVAYGKGDLKSIREFLFAGLFITAIITILIIVGSCLFARYIPALLNLPSDLDENVIVRCFLLSAIGSSLMIFSFSIGSINRGLQASLGIGIIWSFVDVFRIILVVVLLLKGWGLYAIAISPIFAGLGRICGNFGYLFWRLVNEGIGFSVSFRKIHKLLKLTSYTFFGHAARIFSENMDLFFISRFLGPETVAAFSLTRRAPEMGKSFICRPAVAFMPAVSHILGTGDYDKAKAVLLRLARIMVWLLGLFVGSFAALNDDFVRLWVGQQLFAGQTINLIICGGFLLAVSVSSLGNLCFALGNIRGNSIAYFAQAILSISLIIIGIKYLGLIGVALAPVLSMLAVQAWYFPFSFSRLLRLSTQDCKEIYREILKVFVIALPVTVACARFHPNGWLQFSALVGAFCSFYGLSIYIVSRQLRFEIIDMLRQVTVFWSKISSKEKEI